MTLSHLLHYQPVDWRCCRGGKEKKITFTFRFLICPLSPLLPDFQHPPVVSITVFYIPVEKKISLRLKACAVKQCQGFTQVLVIGGNGAPLAWQRFFSARGTLDVGVVWKPDTISVTDKSKLKPVHVVNAKNEELEPIIVVREVFFLQHEIGQRYKLLELKIKIKRSKSNRDKTVQSDGCCWLFSTSYVLFLSILSTITEKNP